MTSNTTTHHRTCNLCEAMCGITVETKQHQIISIRGDLQDPLSRGHICPKAVALQDLSNDPDRLKTPLKKTPQGWIPISWQDAFDEVERRIKKLQADHGNDAIGVYLGNPNVHNLGSMLFAPSFLHSLKTKNKFSATSVDQLPHMLVARLMFGHQLLLPIPDIQRTHHWVIMGANPVVSNGSLMTAPDVRKRLKEVQARGGKVIVLDPRRTETAQLADQHHFVRPNTDVLLLLSVLHTLFDESLVKTQPVHSFFDGLDALADAVKAFPPTLTSKHIGISPDDLKTIAREFAAAPSAVWYGRMGASTQEFGTLCQWLINLINLVTGNFDRPGGAMFTQPAFDVIAARLAGRGSMGRWKSRVRGLPEFAGELPVSVLAEEILTPGKGQIKGLITLAGNPVLSTPNGTQLEQALQQLDFMVSIDFYLNETTRHADLILPPAPPLEREHYDVAFHLLAIHNTAKYSPRLFPKSPEDRDDWQILLELETRFKSRSLSTTLKANAKKILLNQLGPKGILDLGLRSGPYGTFRKGLSLKTLKQHPHGLDLGPMRPCLPQRLATKDKRIQLLPPLLLDDLKRVQLTHLDVDNPIDNENNDNAHTPPSKNDAKHFLLIGRRQLQSNNSWLHNSQRLIKGKNRCTLLLHPEDATRHDLNDGQTVRVSSRVGFVELPVEISDEMMPGVVSIPHGWGHTRPETQLNIAQGTPGTSINDITDELAVDPISGNAVLNGIPVGIQVIDS